MISLARSPTGAAAAIPFGSTNIMSDHSTTTPSQQQQQVLRYTSTDPTVDYDVNVTPLYEYIGNSDWKEASNRCQEHPQEAGTWVVRYRRDSAGNRLAADTGAGAGVQWRFLPIHSACALGPPTYFIRALLQAYPSGPRTLDDQGMLPLHYACGSRISREALYLLLMSYPRAALKSDPNGMLPIHYLARWGPGEEGSIDMVCVATGREHVISWKDGDGNTPEMLAQSAGYDGCEEVARRICEFGQGGAGVGNSSGGGGDAGSNNNNNSKGLTVQTNTASNFTPLPTSPTSPPTTSARPNTDKYSSFEDESAELRTLIEDGRTLIEQPSQFGNENNAGNSVLWNRTIQSSSEQRAIMSKLGVSPVHRGVATGDGGGNRYHSWDGSVSGDGSSPHEGGTRSNDHHHNRNRSIRSVSWDRSTDPPTSSSGAWTTSSAAADPPAAGTDRSFFGSSYVKKDTITSSSSHSSLRLSLPPISPRVTSTTPTGTPKWGNQHHRQFQFHNTRDKQQHSETDEDRRLEELREEISSLRNSGSGSVGSTRREEAEGVVVVSHNSGVIVPSTHQQLQLRESSTSSIATKESSLDDDKIRVRKLMDERRSVATTQSDETKVFDEITKLKSDEERDAAIQTVRNEQKESEKKLLKEISKLKADKHRAEVALSQVSKLAPIISLSHSQSSEECIDDCISKLTFAEVDESETHHDCVEVVVSPKSKKGENNTFIISVENGASSKNRNNLEHLMEEKRKIESAIQRATSTSTASSSTSTNGTSKKSNRGRSKEKKVVLALDEDDIASTSSNSTTMTPFKAAILAETAKRMAKLLEQVSEEKAKSSELEKQVQALKEENDASTQRHSDTMYNHLQEVKLLREGFDEAKVEIDKYRDDAGGMLKAKEEEWKIKERILQEQIQDLNDKCRSAQNAEERKSHEMMNQKEVHKTKEKEWEEKQLVLEEQIKNLREMRVTAQEVGRTEWVEMQRVLTDQIKDLEKQCSAAAQMKDKEVQWMEERKRLEAEIESLKQGKDNGLDEHYRQLESAAKDAEDMRKFNATVRKEHDRAIAELESELTKERNGKTELLSKIVRLEFEIVTLEQELEVAKAKSRQLSNDGRTSETQPSGQESMYLQQISDLRKKIVELQENDDAQSQKLWEANKLRDRALQEKEDECASLVRSLKKQHETVLSEQEDAHHAELRDVKKRLEETIQIKEDYEVELRDAKKKHVPVLQSTPSQTESQEYDDRDDREKVYLQQISDLRQKVQKLQENDDAQTQKLVEASKLRDRSLQEKEEECAALVRTLKRAHETALIEQESNHRTELNDVKRKSFESLNALRERETELSKQLEDVKRNCGDSSTSAANMKQMNDELEALLKQKNEEFEKRISAITVEKDELQLEIQRLIKEADGTSLVVTGLETQLSLCNKEMDKQRRKHRSEMNKMMNTLELQKTKEGRLQNHIHSLEKQIKDMVNDYESRLQDAFYDQM
jgi:hypothetical protein